MKKFIGSAQKEKELPEPAEEKLLEEAEPVLELEPGDEEFIQHAGAELEIPEDLKEHIHSPAQVTRQILRQDSAANLPLTEEKIEESLREKTVWDSILWLATWCVKLAKEAHHKGIKVIFGRGTKSDLVKRGEES